MNTRFKIRNETHFMTDAFLTIDVDDFSYLLIKYLNTHAVWMKWVCCFGDIYILKNVDFGMIITTDGVECNNNQVEMKKKLN